MAGSKCSFKECNRKELRQLLCRSHLEQHDRGQGLTPIPARNPKGTLCLLEDCNEEASPQTVFCFFHLDQKRHSRPFRPRSSNLRVGAASVRNQAGEKRCPRCDRWLVEEQFYNCNSTRDKLQTYCKQCYRDAWLMLRFKMTQSDYERVLESQGGGCSICHTKDTGSKPSFSIDHDRLCCPGDKACEKCVRGILCTRCNTGLGQARDDVEILTSMIGYLNYWRKTNA